MKCISLRPLSLGLSFKLFIFATLATIVARFECFERFSTHSLSGTLGDGGIYLWLLSVVPNALTLENWYNVPAFYPYGQALAWSDNYVLPSSVYLLASYIFSSALRLAPFLSSPWTLPLATVNLSSVVVAHNALLLGATALTGWSVSRLTFRLTGSLLPSYFSCLAVTFCHFFTEHLGHPQLQYGLFLPLSAEVALLLALTPNTSNKAIKIIRAAVLLGIVVGCAFLTAVYYGIFSASIASIILLCWLLTEPSRQSFANLSYLLIGGVLGFSPFIPFLLPYLATEATFGHRGLYEAYYFSAHLLSYLSSGPLNNYWATLGTSSWSHSEAHLSLGIIGPIILLWATVSTKSLLKYKALCIGSLILALATNIHGLGIPSLKIMSAFFAWIALVSGVFIFVRSQRLSTSGSFDVGVLALVILVAIIFSLGPLGNPVKGAFSLGPFAAAHQLIPGMAGIRAVSRWGVVALIFLPILAATLAHRTLEQKTLKLTNKLVFAPYFFWSPLMLLVLLEQFTTGYGKGMEELPKIPAIINNIPKSEKGEKASEAIIFLPMSSPLSSTGEILSWGDFIRRNIIAMFASVHLDMPTINGYSGVKTKIMRDLPRRTRLFPDERSCTALQEISGLRFVVWEQSNGLEIPNLLPSCLNYLGHDDTGNHLFKVKDEIPLNVERTVIAPPPTTTIPTQPTSIALQFSSGCDAVTVEELTNKNLLRSDRFTLIGHASKKIICSSEATSKKMAPRYWRVRSSSTKAENTCFFSVKNVTSHYSIDQIAGAGRCFFD